METIKPQKLKTGDVVGIISPSWPVNSKKELTRGIRVLENMGFKPRLGSRALEVKGNYMAGSRADRLHDFHSMFLDDEVKAIFCTNGGYASIQLLQDIDWEIIRKNPKIFIGFSDITTLLTAITEKTGLITLHGPMVVEGLGSTSKGMKFTQKSLKVALGKGDRGPLSSFTEWKVLRPGKGEGELVGGNLNVLLGLMGTPYEPKWDGKILFWEEVDASIEDIDNYLWRLRLARVFKKIEGMVVGKVTNLLPIDEESGLADLEKPPLIEDIILQATEGFNFPILYGVDFGHDVPSLTLPVGAKAMMDCPASGRVGKLSIAEKYLSE